YTSPTPPVNQFAVSLKLLNANPDTNVSYSLKLGCQNGTGVFPNTNYKSVSSHLIDVFRGVNQFSLVKNRVNGDTLKGIYETDTLKAHGEYTFIVTIDNTKNEKLLILDELNKNVNALKIL